MNIFAKQLVFKQKAQYKATKYKNIFIVDKNSFYV